MPKTKPFTACKCGSTEFYIYETTIHEGEIVEEGNGHILHCHSGEAGGFDKIVCQKCDRKQPKNLDIETQFN